MPKEFTKCVRNGGKVRTKDLGNGKYMHICYDKKGNSHAGEVLTKKKPKAKTKKKEKSFKKKTSRQVVSSAKATLDDLQRLKDYFDNR
jgi:hypothetical protein